MADYLSFNRKGFGAAFFLAGVIYLLLVSGGIAPYAGDDVTKGTVKAGMLVVTSLAFSLFGLQRSAFNPISLFLCIGLAIGLLSMTRSDQIGFAFEKIDGAIVCSAAVALLLSRGYFYYGESKFQSIFLLWALFVLIPTVFYKLQFGFFDRGVRFFLNGPIVYGWIMGICGLMSFHLWKEGRRFIFFLTFLLFVFALVWTESKGSIVAFFVGFICYVMSSFRRSPRFFARTIAVLIIFYIFLFDLLLEVISDSRLAAIARIYSGELSEADDGSVGVRSVLVEKALQDFWSNPIFGIGLGQFSFDEYVYPHNQHVEIFAELGIFVGLIHIVFIAISFWRGPLLTRSIIILCAVGASFSGDASYLRFLYAFCLLGLIQSHSSSDLPMRKKV